MRETTRNKHLTTLHGAACYCMDICRNNTKLHYIPPTCHCNVIAARRHIVADFETFSVFFAFNQNWETKTLTTKVRQF